MFTAKKKFIAPILMAFLFLSLACATSIPFLDTAPEAPPTEAIDQNAIETMIAEAVAQKATQTVAAIPPTKIPTATATQTPIPPSPTATEIPATATPTEIVFEGAGNELNTSEDGLIITYIDHVGAYTVSLPPTWMTLRPNSTEYDEALLLPEAVIPEISKSLEAIKDLDENTFRLVLLDTQEGHYANGFVNNINFVLGDKSAASLEEVFAGSVLALPDEIPGIIITAADIGETSSGLPLGTIASEWDLETEDGQALRIYQNEALFIVNDHPLVITLTSTKYLKEQAVEIFEIMVDHLALVE